MYQRQMYEMLGMMLASATPAIVESIRKAIAKMAVDAEQTENPWDDMLALMLRMIIGSPGEPIEEVD